MMYTCIQFICHDMSAVHVLASVQCCSCMCQVSCSEADISVSC